MEKAREAKYRWLQAVDISGVNLALFHADSLYLNNPAQFEEETLELERRRGDLGRMAENSDQTLEQLKQWEKEVMKK